jgi:hypothetical protein
MVHHLIAMLLNMQVCLTIGIRSVHRLAKGGINSWFYDSPSSTNFTGLPVSGNSLTNVMFLGYYRMTSLTLNSGSSHDVS